MAPLVKGFRFILALVAFPLLGFLALCIAALVWLEDFVEGYPGDRQ